MKERKGEKKEVYSRQLTNSENSFYVLDSLDVTIPDTGDGEFSVEVGSKEKDVNNDVGETRQYYYAGGVWFRVYRHSKASET